TKEFSQAVLKEYTDVVVDDVQKMTPAMATLVGHLCGQASVQSSASFSRVLQDGDECPRTQILERQLLKTSASTGPSVSRVALMQDDNSDKRVKMQAFANQVLIGENCGVSSPVPLKCWQFATSFVNIIKQLRAECHHLSAAEIVQRFLEETDRLETLLSPNSPEQERESLVLADFLRELKTAQNVVKSDQVTFVTPYLQQLRETNLTSSTSREDTPESISTKASGKDTRIRVLPLTSYAVDSLAALPTEDENDTTNVLILMSMRDSKFPGRMKRLTLPLPYDLLSEPYPVQTRNEHLEQCQQLACEALTLGVYEEVVLSFAELATTSSTKREALSRTFQPIWREQDPLPTNANGKRGKSRTESSHITSPKLQSNPKPSANQGTHKERAPPVRDASRFWLSEVAAVLREFMNCVFLPLLPQDKRRAAEDVSSEKKSDEEERADWHRKRDAMDVHQPKSAISTLPNRSPALATNTPYEPKHLSYSQISEYLRCPHRYYLGRVMKLRGDVSTSMMFGRALHEGVAAFAKSLGAAQQNGDITQEVKALAATEAEEAFMRAWAGDGYGLFTSKEQASFLHERGLMALWQFIEEHYADLQLEEIVHVEQEFSFHVTEAKVYLRGVWDRIDRVSDPFGNGSSSFIIKEFKSNMGGAERNMRKLADESLQLKMYMYAYRKVFGNAPYGAKLQQIGGNYGEPKPDTTKARRRRVSRAENDNGFVHFSKAAEQEAKNAIVEVASGLRRGDFDPKPSFAECAFCPYAGSACHFATDDASHERQAASRRASR
ncbi:hypothetical protein PHMEG_00027122, partial [Phytophthora megakarya]